MESLSDLYLSVLIEIPFVWGYNIALHAGDISVVLSDSLKFVEELEKRILINFRSVSKRF